MSDDLLKKLKEWATDVFPGDILFHNYTTYDNGQEPEHYFEEYMEKYGQHLSEDQKKKAWNIFIKSLVCLRG